MRTQYLIECYEDVDSRHMAALVQALRTIEAYPVTCPEHYGCAVVARDALATWG